MSTKRTNFGMGNARTRGYRTLPVLLSAGIAIVLVAQAQTAWAGKTMLAEPFNYTAGTLSGRGVDDSVGDFSNWGGNFEFHGSQWTSDWTAVPNSPVDFDVSSNVLSFGAAGGQGQGDYAGTISRTFSLGQSYKSWTFATTFTDLGDSSENYMATMGFSGAAGNTARMGILDGKFMMQLGDKPEVTAGQVDPNTPYTLVARVDFGVPVTVGGAVQTGERMTVWANETYRRLNEGLAEPLMTVESASGLTSLGNSLDLSAQFASALANTMIWDDLFVGTYYQDVNGFRHDISPTGDNVQEGFFSWDIEEDGYTKTYSRADTGYGDVTMTIGGNLVGPVDGGPVGGVAADLKRGGVRASGELTLSFSGLDAGIPPTGDPYVLKTYHHCPDGQCGSLDIFMDVAGVWQKVATVNPSASGDNPAHASIAFSALDRYANFRFVGDGDVWLNGFELVPEPSTCVLMVIGLLTLGGYGCRQRRKRMAVSK